MTQPATLARLAAKRALEFRLANRVAFEEPCDVYELIFEQGIELQFVDVPSLEGIYLDEDGTRRICVCAHRPSGRQRYTAAHELAHHVFGHGTRLDEVIDIRPGLKDLAPEEILADSFARYILMPPRAVQVAFRSRGVEPAAPDPLHVYRAACWLGVGYTTLLNHLRWSLNLLSRASHERLSKVSPKKLKIKLACGAFQFDVWPLDEFWANRRLHAQVGDLILGLESSLSSSLLTETGRGMYTAREPGDAFLPLKAGGTVRVSVSRAGYVGFYEYRYLPE